MKPVIWKPRYPTRRMRERAWARRDLARERSARTAGGRSLWRMILDRLRG
jgi:hypothetical protein